MKKLVHKREINIRTFDLGNQTVLVEGELIDHQHLSKRKDAKLVHHMVIRLKVKGPEMSIEQAEAVMPHHPRKDCPVVLPWIRNLEGVRIAPGFTMKVKKGIGGVKGCAHLASLVLSMGEAAIQGFWSAYNEEKREEGLQEDEIRKFVNTCYLWRDDGPIIKDLRRLRKEGTRPKDKKLDS